MESNNNLFKQRDKQVEAMASPVDFGLGEERWQHPELGSKWSTWLKNNEKNYEDKERAKRDASKWYNAELFEDIISKNQENDFEYQLINDGEDIEEEIMKYHRLKKASDITPKLKNEYIAVVLSNNRFNKDLTTGAYGRAYGLADNSYGKKQEDPFSYKPQFQQTTPSRASMLNTGQQQIDTSLPAFLQVRNPFHNRPSEAYNPLITKFHTEERINPYAASNPEIFQRRVDAFNQLNQNMPVLSQNDELSRMRFAKRVREETQANLMKRWKEGYFTYPNER
jgi:hypothetical protein